jgi:hypothetical protein
MLRNIDKKSKEKQETKLDILHILDHGPSDLKVTFLANAFNAYI